MPGKTAPEGLGRQIDELDALLDRLLHLPLGPPPAPGPSRTLKIAEPGDSLLEVMDESLDLPILRLPTHDDEQTSTSKERSRPELAALTSELGTFPLLQDDVPPAEHESSVPAILPLHEESAEAEHRQEDREIPWLDDEPPLAPSTAEVTPLPRALAQFAGSGSMGPRVEIIQGSLNSSVTSAEGLHLEASATSRAGMARRLFATWTWLFEVTIGVFLPGLVRPRGKRFLAGVGLVLLGTSLFLAWKWWRA